MGCAASSPREAAGASGRVGQSETLPGHLISAAACGNNHAMCTNLKGSEFIETAHASTSPGEASVRRHGTADCAEGSAAPNEIQPEMVCNYDEAERLQTLLELGMLDQPPEPRFDAITTLMKDIFSTPVSAITLIAQDTIHMHSRAGEWACRAPRRGSFCDWILAGQCPRMLVVEDALQDERFAENRYVKGAPHIRFYAGCPLVGSMGHRYGTLCILDFVPRHFTAEQYLTLCHFAELATRELERDAFYAAEKRKLVGALHVANSTAGEAVRTLDALEEAIMLADMSSPEWKVVYANAAWSEATGTLPHLLDANRSRNGTGTFNSQTTTSPIMTENPILSPMAPFWHVFGGRALDSTEVSAALAAARAGRPFMLSVRSNVHFDRIIGLRFKPISEQGSIGRATMPNVAVPAGLVWDSVPPRRSSSSSDSRRPPRLTRPCPVNAELSDSQRSALAAALAGISGKSTPQPSMATIETAAHAAAAVVNSLDDDDLCHGLGATEPVYYLGVVVQDSWGKVASKFAGIEEASVKGLQMAPIMNRPPPGGATTYGVSQGLRDTVPHSPFAPMNEFLSEEFNNAAGRSVHDLPTPHSGRSDTTTSTSMWDSATSQDAVYLGEAPATQKWISLKAPGMAENAVELAGDNGNSGFEATHSNLKLTEHPPPALQELSLGTMIGCGAAGRAYRGTWRGKRVAVKVVDYWDNEAAVSSYSWGNNEVKTSVVVNALGGAWPGGPGEVGLAAATPFGAGKAPTHPRLVPTYVAAMSVALNGVSGRIHHQYWMIQRFCDRGALGDAIDRGIFKKRLSGSSHTNNTVVSRQAVHTYERRMDVRSVLLTALDVAMAMATLHSAGVIHGSLTGSNVLLATSEEDMHRGWVALVSDYGLVRGCAADREPAGAALMLPSTSPGSAGHSPPEVLLGGPVTPAADVFAFGVLLWEMWEGRQAWRTMSPLQILHAVAIEGCRLPAPTNAPPALASLMAKCMARDLALRPEFKSVVEEIEQQLKVLLG